MSSIARTELTATVSMNATGLPEKASFLMRPDLQGNLWFAGGEKRTSVCRFDGQTATLYTLPYKSPMPKMGMFQVRTAFASSPAGDVSFALGQYVSPKAGFVRVSGGSFVEVVAEDVPGHMGISSIAESEQGTLCVFDDFSGIRAEHIHLADDNAFVQLDFGVDFQRINELQAIGSGLAVALDGARKEGFVLDVETRKVVQTFATHGDRMKLMVGRDNLLTYRDSRLEIRTRSGELLHDISAHGEGGHPLSRALGNTLEKDLVDIQQVLPLDGDDVLLHLRGRQETRGRATSCLRVLNLNSLELSPHALDGAIKSNQVLSALAFDAAGRLWLNQYKSDDRSALSSITAGAKKPVVNKKLNALFA